MTGPFLSGALKRGRQFDGVTSRNLGFQVAAKRPGSRGLVVIRDWAHQSSAGDPSIAAPSMHAHVSITSLRLFCRKQRQFSVKKTKQRSVPQGVSVDVTPTRCSIRCALRAVIDWLVVLLTGRGEE